jgi:MFS family permease
MASGDGPTLGLRNDRRLRWTLVAAALVVFVVELDFFSVQAALPRMASDLDTTATDLQWVVSGYMLAFAAFVIVGGRIGDIRGRRRWLVIGTVGFGVTSLAGGLAPSAAVLIVMRVLQGAVAAFAFPLAIAVVTNAFARNQVQRAVGAVFGFAAIGEALGPLIGGGLTSLIDWRAVLLLNVPICVAAIGLALATVAESRDETAPATIDWPGLALVVASISSFTYGIDRASDWGWSSGWTLGFLAGGLVGGVLFVVVERRSRFPLMDLKLFRIRRFDLMTGAGSVGNIGISIGIFTSMIFLQSEKGLSPGEAGLAFLAFSIGAAAASQIAGRLERFPAWGVMSVALVSGGLGTIAMGLVDPLAAFIVVSIPAGFGFGLSWAYTSVATQAAVPAREAGEASGIVLTVIVTAGAVGIALASSSIEASADPGGHGLEFAIQAVLLAAGVFAVVSSAVVALVGRRMTQPALAPAPSEARG